MTTVTVENINYKEEIRRKTSKPLMWMGIVSIIMFFGGLTSAVIVSQGGGSFLSIEMPFSFTISTFVIILSSLAFHVGLISINKGSYTIAKISVLITLLLGCLFVVTQYMGWVALYESGVYATGNQSTQESSFIYLLTALHVVHLIGGLVSLIVVLVKTMKQKYSLDNSLGMQVSITYWHFLGGLWIFLFFFLRYTIA
ncbi:MAG: cytochrome oxidase subunit III [Flavobacteriales bacterium]|nr:MAG: cytochrome oxidase subunit III [Flavobacteriales bacterium]